MPPEKAPHGCRAGSGEVPLSAGECGGAVSGILYRDARRFLPSSSPASNSGLPSTFPSL